MALGFGRSRRREVFPTAVVASEKHDNTQNYSRSSRSAAARPAAVMADQRSAVWTARIRDAKQVLNELR